MLKLGEVEVLLSMSWSSRIVVASNQVVPARCEGAVMAQHEHPLGAEDGLITAVILDHREHGHEYYKLQLDTT